MEIKNIGIYDEKSKSKRHGHCEVCNQNHAKYTCPRCEIHTCSLNCSQIHKKELDCSGIRDKTKYVSVKKMTDLDFMNDYYFLEEATRFTKGVKSNSSINEEHKMSTKQYKLKKAANTRNIKLFFINNSLSKRKLNQTTYNPRENIIEWYTEFKFVNTGFKTFRKINENATLKDEISKILSENETEKLLDLYKTHEGQMKILQKAPGPKNVYYRTDEHQLLKRNLMNKIIIEYPSFVITLDYTFNDFSLISSDDEDFGEKQKQYIEIMEAKFFNKKKGIHKLSRVTNDEKIAKNVRIEGTSSEKMNHAGSTSDDEDDIEPEKYFFTDI